MMQSSILSLLLGLILLIDTSTSTSYAASTSSIRVVDDKTLRTKYGKNNKHKTYTRRFLQGGKDDDKADDKKEQDKQKEQAKTADPTSSPTSFCLTIENKNECKDSPDCEFDKDEKECVPITPAPTLSYPPTISPRPTTLRPTDIVDTTTEDNVDTFGIPSWLDQLVNNVTSSPTNRPTNRPTVSPTVSPSSSPTDYPSVSPSSSPTISSAPSAAPIAYTRSPRVNIRYTPWVDLTPTEQNLAEQLDYTQETWDTIGTNPIENLDWKRLLREQKTAATQLGYTLQSWDCWQNHYQSYRWIDLDNEYTQSGQWWEMLGWDIYSWNRLNEGSPPSDDLNWYELSVDERYAASQLCYFREVWDEGDVASSDLGEFPMNRPYFRYEHWMALEENKRAAADDMLKYTALNWNVIGLNDKIETKGWNDLTDFERLGAIGIGFTELTWDCWQNHFKSYTWNELEFYGLDFPYSKLGWDELSWDGTESPPPSNDKLWFELTPDERKAASEVCYFRDNWDMLDMTPNNGIFPYPKVKQRYVEWTALPGDIRRTALSSLVYDEDSWNRMGTAEIEKRCWDDLTDQQKADAQYLGFYQRTWDCFQCHYRSYDWDDLDSDSRDALQVLGWSQEMWETEDETPPSYDNEWDRLSETEKSVAPTLCYSNQNWNGTSLETIIYGPEVVVVGTAEDGEPIYQEVEVIGVTPTGEPIFNEEIFNEEIFGGTLGGVSTNGQLPINQGQDAAAVSDVLNPDGTANDINSGNTIGKKRTSISVLFVTFTLFLLY